MNTPTGVSFNKLVIGVASLNNYKNKRKNITVKGVTIKITAMNNMIIKQNFLMHDSSLLLLKYGQNISEGVGHPFISH